VKADVIEMKNFARGKIPESILRAIQHQRRRSGLTHADLADQIGVSRPQMTNALCGRFGLGEQPVARLKAILIEGDAE
jgi:antitoxin component HigA of HigAB toxin-antitoxin module